MDGRMDGLADRQSSPSLADDGELDAEVTHRVQSRWKNWKTVSGVKRERKMNVKIKE